MTEDHESSCNTRRNPPVHLTCFGRDAVDVLGVAYLHAKTVGTPLVRPVDLLVGVVEVPSRCSRLLHRFGIDAPEIARWLPPVEDMLLPGDHVALSLNARATVDVAYRQAARRNRRQVHAAHVAFAVLVLPDDVVQKVLAACGLDHAGRKALERSLPL